MDINFLRSAVTVIGLALFLVLVIRIYSKTRRRAFDEAAQLPFIDDESYLQDDKDNQRRTP